MSDQPYKALVRGEAVEAARSFNWEGAPLKRNLIEEVLNAAAPFLVAPLVAELEEARARLNCDCGVLEGEHWKTHCTALLELEQKLEEAWGALVELIGLRRWLEDHAGRMPDERADAYRIAKGSSHWGRAERIVATLQSSDTGEGETIGARFRGFEKAVRVLFASDQVLDAATAAGVSSNCRERAPRIWDRHRALIERQATALLDAAFVNPEPTDKERDRA